MDLQWITILLMVICLPGACWDLFAAKNSSQREGLQSWLQLAWLGLLIGALGFGVLQKWFGFSEALLIATLVTGVVMILERSYFKPKFVEEEGKAQPILLVEPAWIDLGRSFFPVIFVVFFVRSFIAEPFKIPSGSMIPTLQIGDFILVNKFTYGLRLPVTNRPFIELGSPQRGEVMVFKYPQDPSTDFIKRVVGIPGDVVEYKHKRLTINGQPQTVVPANEIQRKGMQEFANTDRFEENLGTHHHVIQIRNDQPTLYNSRVMDYPNRDACEYNSDGFVCTVPPGHYFMMGDNRDSSSDSRYWGFVPDQNIVGRAFLIWWNFGELSRIGTHIP
jgi:signal peptidase I